MLYQNNKEMFNTPELQNWYIKYDNLRDSSSYESHFPAKISFLT